MGLLLTARKTTESNIIKLKTLGMGVSECTSIQRQFKTKWEVAEAGLGLLQHPRWSSLR